MQRGVVVFFICFGSIGLYFDSELTGPWAMREEERCAAKVIRPGLKPIAAMRTKPSISGLWFTLPPPQDPAIGDSWLRTRKLHVRMSWIQNHDILTARQQ